MPAELNNKNNKNYEGELLLAGMLGLGLYALGYKHGLNVPMKMSAAKVFGAVERAGHKIMTDIPADKLGEYFFTFKRR